MDTIQLQYEFGIQQYLSLSLPTLSHTSPNCFLAKMPFHMFRFHSSLFLLLLLPSPFSSPPGSILLLLLLELFLKSVQRVRLLYDLYFCRRRFIDNDSTEWERVTRSKRRVRVWKIRGMVRSLHICVRPCEISAGTTTLR